MRLLQHTRYHKLVRPSCTRRFRQWLGCANLDKRREALIGALEYRRLHGRTPTLRVIVKGAPGAQPILLDYLRYFVTCLFPGIPHALITSNGKEAEYLAHHNVARSTFHASGRRVDNLRGRDTCAYLVLDADRMGRDVFINYGILRRINTNIAAVITNDAPHLAIIFHTSTYDHTHALALPVLGPDRRDYYLEPPPPLPQNKEYTLTEVPAPHAPDAQETAQAPQTPHPPSHPPSAGRAATSAA